MLLVCLCYMVPRETIIAYNAYIITKQEIILQICSMFPWPCFIKGVMLHIGFRLNTF